MTEELTLTLTEGDLYDYHTGGRYAVVGTAEHWKGQALLQELVIYRTAGADDGRRFACSLGDFALRFTAVPPPPPPAEEKVVSYATADSGR